ncbi:hypothetical protein JAAARDRAFT_206286 [Jaapia argillacea MUCL 33604]|uniref:Uncharacterized protein n=1 Tax=Jaapia argillacea MUCL 33604 TaxID=933084 RepID=A0A067PWV6_9AGAM|nr:hypothetical protein JAAARDRAFT_206286 [Jaapia argillacea MUCL 33604]
MCNDLFSKTELMSIWVQAIVYCFYVLLFFVCTYVCVVVCRSKVLLATTTITSLFCTARVVIGFVAVFFTSDTAHYCDGPNVSLQDFGRQSNQNVFNSVQQLLFTSNELLLDCFLIYRAFVLLQGHRWVTFFPSVMALATAALGFLNSWALYELYVLADQSQATSQRLTPRFSRLLNLELYTTSAFSALAFATNVVLTSIIVGRIWWMTRELLPLLESEGAKKYRKTMAIVIQSGSIFPLTLLAYLITLYLSPIWAGMVLDISSQVAGIGPALLIIRVGLQRETEPEPEPKQTALSVSNVMDSEKPPAVVHSA